MNIQNSQKKTALQKANGKLAKMMMDIIKERERKQTLDTYSVEINEESNLMDDGVDFRQEIKQQIEPEADAGLKARPSNKPKIDLTKPFNASKQNKTIVKFSTQKQHNETVKIFNVQDKRPLVGDNSRQQDTSSHQQIPDVNSFSSNSNSNKNPLSGKNSWKKDANKNSQGGDLVKPKITMN